MFGPLFKGKLVRLAAPLPEDSETLARWSNNSEYGQLLDDDPIRPLPSGHYNFADSSSSTDSFYFHIRTLAEDRLIGFVVLHTVKWASQSAELAIGIGETEYWGKGYGGDTLHLILNYAFNEINLYRVGLTVLDYNTRAIRAYEKAGFVREGAKRKAVQREGQRYDLVYFGLLREEWAQKR